VRSYYHPSVGDYYRYDSFELDYFAIAGTPTGVIGGILTYFARKNPTEGLLTGLVGGGLVGGLFGALYPKRILSWYNPPPFDAPVRYPRRIPRALIPSLIGDPRLQLNLLFYEGAGDIVKDCSGKGNHGMMYGAIWSDEDIAGWSAYFNGSSYIETVKAITLGPPLTLEVLFKPAVIPQPNPYPMLVSNRLGDVSGYIFRIDNGDPPALWLIVWKGTTLLGSASIRLDGVRWY